MLEKSKALLEESRKRRSYRSFLPDPIDMEVIKNCVLTAGTAPNGADQAAVALLHRHRPGHEAPYSGGI